jgi:hypothetical protein
MFETPAETAADPVKMDATPPQQAGDMSASSGAQLQRRVRALKAAFQRQLGHKPDTLEKMLRDHAARAMAKAEAAACDSTISANDYRAISSEARKARLDFERVVARNATKPAAASSLDEYLRQHPDRAAP